MRLIKLRSWPGGRAQSLASWPAAGHKSNVPHPGADQALGTHRPTPPPGLGLAVDGHPAAVEVAVGLGRIFASRPRWI
jgi:hypothetical protein